MNTRESSVKLLARMLALSVIVTACGRAQDLNGAGATFPYPIYSKWFTEYAAKTGVKINYQSIGSGGGIKQLSEQTVDFGASDGPMSDAELAKAKVPNRPRRSGRDVQCPRSHFTPETYG
jgi:phosphate transport system substrate-binding protein